MLVMHAFKVLGMCSLAAWIDAEVALNRGNSFKIQAKQTEGRQNMSIFESIDRLRIHS